MSLTFVSMAIESRLDIEKKFVLLLLADNGDPSGKGSISLEYVAEKCGLGLDLIEGIVENLVMDGIITPYDFSYERPESTGFSFKINSYHGIFNPGGVDEK